MKNLSIFEPQIEKHYAYKKTCSDFWYFDKNYIMFVEKHKAAMLKAMSSFQAYQLGNEKQISDYLTF